MIYTDTLTNKGSLCRGKQCVKIWDKSSLGYFKTWNAFDFASSFKFVMAYE